jgi:protein-tyrosine phosphatase
MGSGGSKRGSSGGPAGSKKNRKAKKGKKAVAAPPEETTVTVDVLVDNGAAASATAAENGTVQNENGATAGEKDGNATTAATTLTADPPPVTLRQKNPQSAATLAAKTRAGSSAHRTSFYETVDAAEILPHLVMGNLPSSRNTGFLRGKHVAFVLDLTTDGEVPGGTKAGPFLKDMGIQHFHVGIEDDEDEEISGHFDTCFEFINKASKTKAENTTEGKKRHSAPGTQKTVLVHSNYGLSRTSAIVLAYLMREKQWSLRAAHEHLRKCHTVAKPNDGFVVQLLRYEQELHGTMSMTLKDFYKQP